MKLRSFILWLTVICALQHTIFAQSSEILINQAREAIEKQDYPTATKILDMVIASNSRNDAAFAQRARIHVRQNNFDSALADAEKSLALNPKNVESLNVRGLVMREFKKDANAAIADFTQAISLDPKYYYALYNRGYTFGFIGKNNEAITDFSKASEISPTNPAPLYARAMIYQKQERFTEAIADFSKVIALNEKHADSYAQRAFSYYSQAKKMTDPQVPLARADVEKALQLNPKQSSALAVRGALKYQDKDYDGAFADLEESYKINPNNDWVKNALKMASKESPAARAKIREVKLPEAKKKLEMNIWDYQSYLQMDELFKQADPAGNDWLARDYWQSLIAANPKNICAIRFLGEYKGGSNWREMTNFLNDGLNRFDGKNGAECAAEIAFRIGREYTSRLLYDEAETYLKRAKEIKSNLKYIQSNIDSNLAKKEEDRKEKEALEKQIAANSKPLNSGAGQKQLKDKIEQLRTDSAARRKDVENARQEIRSRWENYFKLSDSFFAASTKTRADALKVQAELKAIKQICENILAKYESKMIERDINYFRKEKADAESLMAKFEEMLKQMPQ